MTQFQIESGGVLKKFLRLKKKIGRFVSLEVEKIFDVEKQFSSFKLCLCQKKNKKKH